MAGRLTPVRFTDRSRYLRRCARCRWPLGNDTWLGIAQARRPKRETDAADPILQRRSALAERTGTDWGGSSPPRLAADPRNGGPPPLPVKRPRLDLNRSGCIDSLPCGFNSLVPSAIRGRSLPLTLLEERVMKRIILAGVVVGVLNIGLGLPRSQRAQPRTRRADE